MPSRCEQLRGWGATVPSVLDSLSRGLLQKRCSSFLRGSGLDSARTHCSGLLGQHRCPSWLWVTILCCLLYVLTFTSSFSLCSGPWYLMTSKNSVTPGRGPRSALLQLQTPVSPKGAGFLKVLQHQVSEGSDNKSSPPQAPHARPLAEPLLRGNPGRVQAPSRPQIRFRAPPATAAPRLRAEPPVGREVSRSSWHSLIEQSGFVSEDSCGDEAWLCAGGGGRLGGWIWEAEEGEAKGSSVSQVGGRAGIRKIWFRQSLRKAEPLKRAPGREA